MWLSAPFGLIECSVICGTIGFVRKQPFPAIHKIGACWCHEKHNLLQAAELNDPEDICTGAANGNGHGLGESAGLRGWEALADRPVVREPSLAPAA
jgi:hypothetical protein